MGRRQPSQLTYVVRESLENRLPWPFQIFLDHARLWPIMFTTSFANRSIEVWNSLDSDIFLAPSLYVFKNRLTNLIL